jgi:hypothetical protein
LSFHSLSAVKVSKSLSDTLNFSLILFLIDTLSHLKNGFILSSLSNVEGRDGFIDVFKLLTRSNSSNRKETPGLGAEVDNDDWKDSWVGKKIYQNDEVALTVIKGKVASDDPSKIYKVDGLSGATITGRGVSNMIAYWFGNSGYSKLLQELDYES